MLWTRLCTSRAPAASLRSLKSSLTELCGAARGAICDRQAIVDACESGQLAGYAGAASPLHQLACLRSWGELRSLCWAWQLCMSHQAEPAAGDVWDQQPPPKVSQYSSKACSSSQCAQMRCHTCLLQDHPWRTMPGSGMTSHVAGQ